MSRPNRRPDGHRRQPGRLRFWFEILKRVIIAMDPELAGDDISETLKDWRAFVGLSAACVMLPADAGSSGRHLFRADAAFSMAINGILFLQTARGCFRSSIL